VRALFFIYSVYYFHSKLDLMAPITVELCRIRTLPFSAPFSAPLFSAGINFSEAEKREQGDLTRL